MDNDWLTPRQVKVFFLVILLFAILGALTSCNHKSEVYYLQVNDYNEETVCINIVNQNDEIIVLLDRYVEEHKDSDIIIKVINDAQLGFSTPYAASEAYWSIVRQ